MSGPKEPKPPRDYEVGYGKPPKHGQFQPGHKRSGGPRRRQSIEGEIEKALRKKITIRQNGEVAKVTVVEALARKLIAEGLAGQRWAFESIAQALRHLGGSSQGSAITALLEQDRAILEQLAAKVSGNADDD